MRTPDLAPLRALEPPADLKLRVLAGARQRPAPARSGRVLPILLRIALAVTAMIGVLMAAGGPDHARAAGRPEVSGAWILAGIVALAVVATWLTLPDRRSMLAPPRGQLLAVAIGVPILTGAWLMLWHTTYQDPYVRMGIRCIALTALTAPWPFLVLRDLGRRLDPRHPALAGASLGATAGAWAAVMVELWWPLAVPDHVLVGHVLPLVALSMAGAFYGARRLRLRPVPLGPAR